jgi:futalosine hydrolase
MIVVVTAVEAERDAVLRGVPAGAEVTVLAAGVGPAAAAAGTAWCLARLSGVTAVLSAGIGGGVLTRVHLGDLAVATRSIAADLGADSPDGFLTLDDLGFGVTSRPATDFSGFLPGAVRGAVVSVSTVTGTAARAADLAARYPDVVAEGMEGFGVATACALAGVAFGEVRAISNAIGPRDRAAWQIKPALDALAEVGAAVATLDG